MLRGNLARLLVIGALLAAALAALAFSHIDVGAGDLRFRRGGDGPLGLRLGLDLRGGVHLVYQAVRSPNSIRVQFADGAAADAPKVTAAVKPVLARQGRSVEQIEEPSKGVFAITVACLRAAAREEEEGGISAADRDAIQEALRQEIGNITSLRVTGCEQPTREQMEGVTSIMERRVNEFGVTEPTIQILGNDRLLVQLPGVGDTEIRATFTKAVEAQKVRDALTPFGRAEARIEKDANGAFTIRAPSLKPAQRDAQGKVLQPAEQDQIKEALEKVAPFTSFTVSGGIEEAKQLIGQTAVLEFKHRECKDILCTKFQDNDLNLTGDDLQRAFPDRQPTSGAPIVSIEFNSRGAGIFGNLTARIAQPHDEGILDRIAIFLDKKELLAPVARQAILGGQAFIEGPDFTSQRVRTLAIQLESGRLPIPITAIEERDVDATLGADSLRKSLVAGYIGLGLVLLFMLLYYRVPGLMAGGALGVYTALSLAIFKLFPITLTLAGVAGFILSIGMAVDANVLIFERTKEELRAGRSLLGAIETGFSRAWPSIRDSNVSTFITCAILWWFGSRLGASLVVGFAVTLFIGVAVSMFTAVFVSRTFLRLVIRTPLQRAPALFTPVAGTAVPASASSTLRRR